MKKSKEIPIGGIGVINGYRVMAKEYLFENTCDDCCFGLRSGYHRICPIKACSANYRKDKKHVYFVIAKEAQEACNDQISNND